MANLFEITYANRDTSNPYRLTSSAADQSYGGNTYTASQISRGEIFFEFSKQGFKIELSKSVEPMPTILANGLGNPLNVKIMELDGTIVIQGFAKKINYVAAKDLCKITVEPLISFDGASIPTRPLSPSCPFALYEGFDTTANTTLRCPVNRASFKTTESTPSNWSKSSDGLTLTYASAGLTAGVFDLGQAIFTKSSVEIEQNYIKSNTATTITFLSPVRIDLSTLDSFDLYQGCNKRIATTSPSQTGDCETKFSVGQHFGGFPHLPTGFMITHKEIKSREDTKTARNEITISDDTDGQFVPILYGKASIQGLPVWRSNAASVMFFEAVKWNLTTGGVVFQRIGNSRFGHFVSWAEIIAEQIDSIEEVLLSKEGVAIRSTAITSSGTSFTGRLDYGNNQGNDTKGLWNIAGNKALSGGLKKARNLAEIFSPSTLTAYLGDQTTTNSYINLHGKAPNDLFYKDLAYVTVERNKLAQAEYDGGDADDSFMENIQEGYSGAYIGQADLKQDDFPRLTYLCTNYPELNHTDVSNPALNKTITESGSFDTANPANILFDILTTFLNIPKADIDGDSFEAARDTIFTESLGLTIVLKKRIEVKKVIADILTFMGATLNWRYKSSASKYLWTLKLLRYSDAKTSGSYPTGTEFDDSTCANVQFDPGAWDNVVTDVIIEYKRPDHKDKLNLVFVNEAARRQVRGIKKKKFDLKIGASTNSAIAHILSREASRLTRPLRKVTFDYFHDSTRALYAGDVIELSSSSTDLPIQEYRIIKVSGLKEADNKRRIIAVEKWDESAFTPTKQTGTYTIPDIDLSSLNDYRAFPAWHEIAFPNQAITVFAEKGNKVTNGVIAEIDSSNNAPGSVQRSNVSNIGYIDPGLSAYTDVNFIDETGYIEFIVNSANSSFSQLTATDDEWFSLRFVCVLYHSTLTDGELISFKTLTDEGGGVFRITGLIRNVSAPTTLANPITGVEGVTYPTTSLLYFPFDASLPSFAAGSPHKARQATPNTEDEDMWLHYDVTLRNNVSFVSDTTDFKIIDLDANGDLTTIKPRFPYTPYPVSDLEKISKTVGATVVIEVRYMPTFPQTGAALIQANNVKPDNADLSKVSWLLTSSGGENIEIKIGSFITSSSSSNLLPSGWNELSCWQNSDKASNYFGYIYLKVDVDSSVDPTGFDVQTKFNGFLSEKRTVTL